MSSNTNKQWVSRTIVLAIDCISYLLVQNAVIEACYSTEYFNQGNHKAIAMLFGVMCFLLVSLIFPLKIVKRKIRFSEVLRRSFWVSLLTQLTAATIWIVMTDRLEEIIKYNGIVFISLFIVMSIVRLLEMLFMRYLRRSGRNLRTVLLVGDDPALLMLYREMRSNPDTGYKVVGYYGDGEIVGAPAELKRLGRLSTLLDVLEGRTVNYTENYETQHVDELYCSVSRKDRRTMEVIMRHCDQQVTRFFYVPRQYYPITLSLKPENYGDMIVYTNHHEPLSRMRNRAIKRVFDIVFSGLVLLCMLPFLPIIAFIIKKQSPGPIFFKQVRTGLKGEDFDCYKFRSMHVNADSDKVQATKDDPRKFAFGNFMREHNIDELPQFFNVLKGDMSIVGPRPHMKLHTEQYSPIIDQYMVRHFEKPGITGLAQVTGFRGETKELSQMEGRVEKDIWYVEHWSFWLDIKICWLTAKSFIVKDDYAY